MSTSQFTKIITSSDLISLPPQSNAKFTTVITKNSLLENNEPLDPIPNNIIKYYDQMSPTLDSYQKFVDVKLRPWQNTLKFKYFSSMYHHQQSTFESIKRL